MTHLPPAAETVKQLHELAQLSGVSTSYWDWHGQLKEVTPTTLIRVFQALGIPITDTPSDEEIRALITRVEDDRWMTVVPDCTIQRVGNWQELHIHVPDGESVTVEVTLEDGSRRALAQIDNWDPPRSVNGNMRGRAGFALDESLPLGYHTITASLGNGESATGYLIVVPQRLNAPALDTRPQQWGISSQLYSVRSADAWGIGDTRVLGQLNLLFGQLGADFHLINPVHSAAPTLPIEPSPYLPVTRQFRESLYIHPEDIPEYHELPGATKLFIKECHSLSKLEQTDMPGLIDRDHAWIAKAEALRHIYRHGRSAAREADFEAYIADQGDGLVKFATWCALVETHGMDLPEQYTDARSAPVRQFAEDHSDLVRFHMWMQWVLGEQLDNAQAAARAAGMSIGVMSDLAVGVHPYGSEVWAEPHMFAAGMTVGAPPDMYSQLGQNWSQPPWNPRALARYGYAPLRTMIRAAVAHSGAVRIDHILGLFRLWWIPKGMTANHGTYVTYDHEAMVGVLLLEAQRAGSVVIGEDLGTVEPWVRGYLNERGVLGTSILWFERDETGQPIHADRYRENALTAVNTHDLPPTAGYLRGVQTTIRHELGLIVDDIAQVRAHDRRELDSMIDRLIEYGLLSADEREDEQAVIDGLYRYIAQTPSRLLAVSLVDIVRDLQPQNFPGTHMEYPNWRLPLADDRGIEVTVDRLLELNIARFADVMNAAVGKDV
ncbi:MAG: 4-alpha-glucanotransferase [Actinomycetaceae bacterium]|nr:4-alpha-glucanotransferase [Actinomycetaceae bacterium]